MNAQEYVRKEATSFGYCGKIRSLEGSYSGTEDSFHFMQKQRLSEEELDAVRDDDTDILRKEIDDTAAKLETALLQNAREYLIDWDIRLNNYDASVEFDNVTCEIVFTHRKTGANIVLGDVYFTNEGEILQTVISF